MAHNGVKASTYRAVASLLNYEVFCEVSPFSLIYYYKDKRGHLTKCHMPHAGARRGQGSNIVLGARASNGERKTVCANFGSGIIS